MHRSLRLCTSKWKGVHRHANEGCLLTTPTLGPKETPPPGRRGVRREPMRALPVPFCAYGFLPPPRTSERVRVLAVPCSHQWFLCLSTRWG